MFSLQSAANVVGPVSSLLMPSPRDPIRLALVLPCMVAAGAERVVLDVAEHLDRGRVLPTLITLVPPGYKPGWELDAEFGRIPELRHFALDFRGLHLKQAIRSGPLPAFKFASFIAKEKFDIVHSHLFPANMLTLTFGMQSAAKVVVTEHFVMNEHIPRDRIRRSRLLRRLYQRADCTSFVCEASARSFRDVAGFAAEKMEVVLNGTGLDRFTRVAPDPVLRRSLCSRDTATIFVTAARLTRQKGLDLIPPIAAQLGHRGIDAQFIIAGQGPDEQHIRQLIARYGVADRVTLLGHRGDVPELLAASDVFLLPTRYEGLPISVIEAMAAGLPVITTDVAGNPEVVARGETGLLARCEDVGQLVEYAASLARDKARAKALGARGRMRALELFTDTAMTRRYEDLYVRLATGGPPRGLH